MAISFVNAGTEGAASAANITLGAPASPQSGDIWIAACVSADQTAHTFTDWTQVAQFNGDGTTLRISVWYFRYVDAAPNLVVTMAGGGTHIGGIAAFRGCVTSGDPVDTVGSTSTGADASIEYTAITPTVDDCMVLAINGVDDDNTRDAPPTGFAACLEDTATGTDNCYKSATGTPDASVAIHWLLQTTKASTGSLTETQSANDSWGALYIALKPPLAAPDGVGAVTLPKVAVSGTGTLGIPGAGAVALPKVAVAGTGSHAQAAVGTGAIVLPKVAVAGVGAESLSGVGALAVAVPAVAGTGVEGIPGTGALTLPTVATAGSGAETLSGVGTVALPTVAVSGTGEHLLAVTGAGAVTLPTIAVSGTGEHLVAVTGTGALTLWAPSVSGAGEHILNAVGSGAVALSTVAVSGTGAEGIPGSGAVSLLAPSITGTGAHSEGMVGTGAITLPLPSISGAGIQTQAAVGSGALLLSTVAVRGSGTAGELGGPGTGWASAPLLSGTATSAI